MNPETGLEISHFPSLNFIDMAGSAGAVSMYTVRCIVELSIAASVSIFSFCSLFVFSLTG